MGIIHITDQLSFIEGGQSDIFTYEVDTIYTASLFQLECERLHIEVWDTETFYFNKFMSYNTIPLVDIVDGPMSHTVQCFPYNADCQPGKLNATVNLKINLAEIWDFYLEFMDWKTSSLKNREDPTMDIDPFLEFQMIDP